MKEWGMERARQKKKREEDTIGTPRIVKLLVSDSITVSVREC